MRGVLLAASMLLLCSPRALALDTVERSLHLISIGASDCGMCRGERTKQALGRIRNAVREWAARNGFALVETGVATDVDVARGIEFLREGMPYDQVIVGRGGLLNEATLTFVAASRNGSSTDDFPDVALPRLLLLFEEIRTRKEMIAGTRRVRVFDLVGGLIVFVAEQNAAQIAGWLDARPWEASAASPAAPVEAPGR